MSVINLNSVEPGVFYPETYYIEGETDYTNAFQAAVTAANTYVENSDGNDPYRNAVIRLQPGKFYKITKGFFLNFGVSIDGQGATIAPVFSDGTCGNYPIYSSSGLRYVFIFNMKEITSGNTSTNLVIDIEYPWIKSSFIKNLQVRVSNSCSGDNTGRLGFALVAAPMTIKEIATYNVCPVIDTPISITQIDGVEHVCYLDGIKIDHVRSDYDNTSGTPVCPYVIRKRCYGDGMVINQLINECGDFSNSDDSLNKKNYGLSIDNTYGLTISNCIHADGLIRFCSDVTYQSNHNEKGSLTIHYSNISISNCRFHKPLHEPTIIISEFSWSDYARQCFHTVRLEDVVFSLHNYLPYGTDYEEIRFCGKNATRLYYKNVQVTTFGPVPSRAMDKVVRPSTGFRFSKYRYEGNYTKYDCAFREGWIETIDDTVKYMTNQNIVSPVNPASYSIGYAIVETAGSQFPSFSVNGTYQYKYDLWMVNDKYGGIPIGVYMSIGQMATYENDNESITGEAVPISVSNGQYVRFSLVLNNDITHSTNALDGCFIIMKRTNVSTNSAVYVRMPVSHNGHFVDTGDWINARKWVTENLVPSSFSIMQHGDRIIIGASGIYKIRNTEKTSGTTQERPHNVTAGAMYFDTTRNKPIWVKSVSGGVQAWVDANGNSI